MDGQRERLAAGQGENPVNPRLVGPTVGIGRVAQGCADVVRSLVTPGLLQPLTLTLTLTPTPVVSDPVDDEGAPRRLFPDQEQ